MQSGSSAYMKEDLLKRKFIATWHELCKLVGISPDIEITYEDLSAGYTKTPYPEINRRVTRLLKRNEFPDHYDIIELVERCNTKHNLGISVEEKAQLSREVFKDVGKLLKAQRAKDFKAHFGSHLTDDALKKNEDPASKDSALLEMLRKSLREGQEKLEELCEGFVLKQEVENEQERSTEGDACESDESEEEDEEEEEGEGQEAESLTGAAEGEEEGVESLTGAAEGEEEGAESLTGVAEGEDGVPMEEDIEESSDSEGSVEDIDIKTAGDEKEREEGLPTSFSKSSDESEEASPAPDPVSSSMTDKDGKDDFSTDEEDDNVPQQRTVKRKNSDRDRDTPPQTKKVKVNDPNDSEQAGVVNTSSHEAKRDQKKVPPTAAAASNKNVILLDDDDSDSDDVIVLD